VRRFWFFGRVLLVLAALARPSYAHDPFEITTVVGTGPDALVVEATMAGSTALRLLTGRSSRATLTAEAFQRYKVQLEQAAPSFYEITSAGQPIPPRTAAARFTDESDVEIVATYAPPTGAPLSLRASHLLTLPQGYTTAISVVENGTKPTRFKLLTAEDPVFELPRTENGNATKAESPLPAQTTWERFQRFVLLGAKHVLTGYDHLLFLVGVLIACRTLPSMLVVVTTFTVAHSLTLALAVLGHVVVFGRIVEPLIAASIVFVGIENVRRQDALWRRVAITFAFGLVHGLGFAGALDDLQLRLSALPLTLFAFNLGVELGQLAVTMLALPLLMRLHATQQGLRVVRLSALVLSGMGMFWFIERLA
jgi:hypothetical protein